MGKHKTTIIIEYVIWKGCPQDVFVSRSSLEMGVASAVISFNDGQSGILKVMENLSMNPGVMKEIILELKKRKRNQHQK